MTAHIGHIMYKNNALMAYWEGYCVIALDVVNQDDETMRKSDA